MKNVYKHILKSLMIVLMVLISMPACQIKVSAQGSISVSTDHLSMSVGDVRHFTIKADNAVGSIDIRSDDENIVRVNYDSLWIDNETLSVEVTAYKTGTCNIIVEVVDGATYDEEAITPAYTISVEVSGDAGPQEVMMPYASMASGEIPESNRITLSCDTPDAVIYYAINDDEHSLYEDVLTLSKDQENEEGQIVIDMYAHKDGNYIDSEHVNYTYTVVESVVDQGDLSDDDMAEYGYDDIDDIPKGFWVAGIKDYDYTGKSIVQDGLKVYHHTVLLKEKTDYKLSYSNNVKAGTAVITIKGKGNYTDSLTRNFSIRALDISIAEIDDLTLLYKNKEQKVEPKVIYNGKTLKKDTDYVLSVNKVQALGTYDVTVTGQGNYKGTNTFTVTVSDKKLIGSLKYETIPVRNYDGSDYKPSIVFKPVNGVTLREGVDYSITYEDDCSSAGNHYMTVTALPGSAHVSGSRRIAYTIKGTPLSAYKYADLVTMDYNGKALTQADPRLYAKKKVNGQTVKDYLDEDSYTITYSNNVNAGKATITYTGINGYTGTLKKTFKIAKTNLNGSLKPAILMDNSYVYVKGGVKPEPVVVYKGKTLVNGVDYKLTYKNNNKVNDNSNAKKLTTVIITGKGNFTGSVSRAFKITAKSLNEVELIAKDVSAGTKKKSLVLYDTNGKKLGSSDYKVVKICYAENVKLANGKQRYRGETVPSSDKVPANTMLSVTVRGKNGYTGTRTAYYKTFSKSISGAKATIAAQAYTGLPITLKKSDIVVKLGKTILTANDYDIVSYRNNIKTGKAYILIKGKGIYGGMTEISFTIAKRSLFEQ